MPLFIYEHKQVMPKELDSVYSEYLAIDVFFGQNSMCSVMFYAKIMGFTVR